MHPIHTCTPLHSHVQPSHTHTILTHSDVDATGLDDLRQAVELINNNEFRKAEALLKPQSVLKVPTFKC